VLVDPGWASVSEELASAGYQKQEVKQGWTLWKDPTSLPRVRWGNSADRSAAGEGIQWFFNVNSIEVSLSKWPGRELVFAFAANQGLETCIAGHCSPVVKSDDGLVRVDVPPGTRHVRLVYHNAVFLPALFIALSTLVVYVVLLLRERRANCTRLRVGSDSDHLARL
jgi:hypothetical protein